MRSITLELTDKEFEAVLFALGARPVVSNDDISEKEDAEQIDLTLALLKRLEAL